MLDFTTTMYEKLCKTIVKSDYSAVTVADFLEKNPTNVIILRHDVDRVPSTALTMAKIEHKYNLCSTYYFRHTDSVFKEDIIREIAALGHEIGYHYETLSKAKGDCNRAGKLFKQELQQFRAITSVKTASMHGRPLSKWNNLDLFDYHGFEAFDLLGEAYLSIDFRKVHYYSDTGRTWHGSKYNVRDKVESIPGHVELETTMELIELVRKHQCDSLCLLTHPNRWTDSKIGWAVSYFTDSVINLAKITIKTLRT